MLLTPLPGKSRPVRNLTGSWGSPWCPLPLLTRVRITDKYNVGANDPHVSQPTPPANSVRDEFCLPFVSPGCHLSVKVRHRSLCPFLLSIISNGSPIEIHEARRFFSQTLRPSFCDWTSKSRDEIIKPFKEEQGSALQPRSRS